MNYRHAYHAGNICDVVKHAVLTLLIEYMQQKDKGLGVLDTHAGCGLYDLSDERAQKTQEAEAGAHRVWNRFGSDAQNTPDVLAPYLTVLRQLNPDGSLRLYPGSPLLARQMLRPQDRLMACELHPEDVRELRRCMRDDKQAQTHHRDGYEALKALLPMPEKRGLVLIDPPFEAPDKFDALTQAAKHIHAHFPQAVAALWYPIKERPTIWKFHEGLTETGVPKMMVAEFIYHDEFRHDRLNGSGFVFLNPPWTLEKQLNELFPLLHDLLETRTQKNTIKQLTT